MAVRIAGPSRTVHFLSHVNEIAALGFERAAIDIPIGMTDGGIRECDLVARKMLKPHASRVFTGARRWLWEKFDDPDKANRDAVRRGQSRVSRQLWHLGPKIMEVDAFVRASRSRCIRETHPELVFLRLNNGRPLASKKSESGIATRRRLLGNEFPDLGRWLAKERLGTGAKIDDVLDACACAIAASDMHLNNCLPQGKAPEDEFSLPMQIWY